MSPPASTPQAALRLPKCGGAYGLGQYGSSTIDFNGTQGDGSGQTIAIVTWNDDPNIISDANEFSSYFGLPQFKTSGGPSLAVFNELGGTSLPTTQGNGQEESLDVEWAHAISPMANIVVFEASSGQSLDLLTAEQTAAAYPGVSVVSNSWDFDNPTTGVAWEIAGETGDDSSLITPAGHEGVTFVFSTGDNGEPGGYPAYSPNVLAVGGTTLYVNGNSYVSESGWTRSGGGISEYEPQPNYQILKVNGNSSTNRTIPDVAMDAGTAVPIYDSLAYWIAESLG